MTICFLRPLHSLPINLLGANHQCSKALKDKAKILITMHGTEAKDMAKFSVHALIPVAHLLVIKC